MKVIFHPEADRLDSVVTLVEAYEHKNPPMAFPDLVEAIKSRLEDLEDAELIRQRADGPFIEVEIGAL